MNTVYLHGDIRRRFGEKYQIDARSSEDIIKGLDANNEGFIAYIVKQELEGNRHFLLAKHPDKIKSEQDLIDNIIAENEINREIHIVPSVYGGFVAMFLGKFVTAKVAGAMASALWGGLAQMAIGALQKTPENKPVSRGENEQSKSFLLSASRETATQGGSIPLGYGRLFIGPSLIGQSLTTERIPPKKDPLILESSTRLTFSHLLSEGPIEGPVNEYGAKINPWNKVSNVLEPNPDVQKALYLNESQVQKGEFFNYNLNEIGVSPSVNISKEESSILDDYVGIVHTYNQELFGVSPYYHDSVDRWGRGVSKDVDRIAIDNVFPEEKDAEKPTIFSHKISNINTTEVIINFRSSVFLTKQEDGKNLPEKVYFAVFISDSEGNRQNVLDAKDKYIVRFENDTLRDSAGNDLRVYKDSSNAIYVYGIATSAYQFEFSIKFKQLFKKDPPIVQVVKLSKETDISAASNIYTTWTTTSRKWWGGKKVHQHSKTDWNNIGGQGRSRMISVSSIEERVGGKFSYPDCATSRVVVDSLNFASQPTFMWHLKLKKVLVPSNYNTSTKQYVGPWNGLFKGQQSAAQSIYSIDEKYKEWTDNPGWIFYDLLTHPTYGCGKYGVESTDVDKWQIYKIAKYCDEMVETNYPIQTSTGMLRTFEYEGSVTSAQSNSHVIKNSPVSSFSIKIDDLVYYKQDGDLLQKTLNRLSYATYREFTSFGEYSMVVPYGVDLVEVTTVGGGGSGQVINSNFSVKSGFSGESSSVSNGSWSISSEGGVGGGSTNIPTSFISGHTKILAKVNGLNEMIANGSKRMSSSDYVISGMPGSESQRNGFFSASSSPGFGAGSGAGHGNEWFPIFGRSYVTRSRVLNGGGSAAAASASFKVSSGQLLSIVVGSGGQSNQGGYKSSSGAGGSGMVAIRFYRENDYVGLSAREQFVKTFGEGDSLKGKSVAFFINKHNYGLSAKSFKEEIKKKSVLKENCVVERRQIIKSDPDTMLVTLSGEDFNVHQSSFEALNDSGTKKSIMYGACVTEIDHPIVEPRFSANLYLKNSSESLNILNAFANIFRSRLSYSSGKISIQQDSKGGAIQLFNNSNVSKEGFMYSGSQKNQRFSVAKVMFNNKENEYKQEFVYEEDTAAIQKIGIVETEMNALSVSSESEARRLAKWILLSAQYEQEVVKFVTGQEGSYSFPGSIIEIYDNLRSSNFRSGRVLDIQEESDSTYCLVDKSVLRDPILGDIEFTVSSGSDQIKLDRLEDRAKNEKSKTDQEFEIDNLRSSQLIKFRSRIIPDQDELRSRVTNLELKLMFEVAIEESVLKVFYHGLNDGDNIKFESEGVLPSGLSPFLDYYSICCSKHSFKVSRTPPVFLSGEVSMEGPDSTYPTNVITGIGTNFSSELNIGDTVVVEGLDFIVNDINGSGSITVNKSHYRAVSGAKIFSGVQVVNMFNLGKDRLGNIGGTHFVCPQSPLINKERIDQIMIGSMYSIRGDIGVLENNKSEISSEIKNRLGISGPLSESWVDSELFGQMKIADLNWIYAKNLGWVFISDILEEDSYGYFWVYVDSIGWVGIKESDKAKFWYIPGLVQAYQGCTGFIQLFKNSSGNISNVFAFFESGDYIQTDLSKFFLGGSSKKLGRATEVKEINKSSDYGYYLNISDYGENISTFSLQAPPSVFNDSKFQKIKITSGVQVNPGTASQQQYSLRLNIENNLEFDLSKNYNVVIRGVSDKFNLVGVDSDDVNKVWNFIFINENTLELCDSVVVALNNDRFDYSNAYLYILNELDNDFKAFVGGQYFKVLNNKEMGSGQFEITATEYSYDKFDAIDKKGVIRKPVMPIPPQEGMDIPEPPTNLILTSSTE